MPGRWQKILVNGLPDMHHFTFIIAIWKTSLIDSV